MTPKAAMTKNNSRLPEGDDGHTIANMNVEGMPWYREENPLLPPRQPQQENQPPREQMTARQTRIYTWGAVKAGLLVVGCMCLGIVLFILFCVHVWFRGA